MLDMQKSTAYHPFFQIMFLIVCAMVAAVVFTIIGVVIWALSTTDEIDITMLMANPLGMDINLLRTLQIASSLGLFIAAPIIFARINEVKPKTYFYLDKGVSSQLLLIAFLLMLFATPVFEWVALLNQKMDLPSFLKHTEEWMKAKEVEAGELTKRLLVMNNYGDLAINLLMIAVIPAIGEELFFRGALQNIFGQWFNSSHIAIWVTAIIFSAIHLQFFGFFPRLLLGALFGYLLVYGRSMYLPILGHFMNNGLAVVMAFMWQREGKSLNDIEKSAAFNTSAYVISGAIALLLLLYFFKQAKTEAKLEVHG